ncbi:MAG TPA: hydrogen peroxide-dependent heme synthase [Actinomycetota bacterium]|nr:hydrogen peroxide-dependent heme synthase [Actinomycetota bacterium]
MEETYAYYPAFQAADDLRERPQGDLEQLAHEAEVLFKEWADRVQVRAVYSTVGFRPDVDLLMWWVGHRPEDLQELLVAFRRTGLGRGLVPTWTFLGVVRPAEFTPDHVPAFVRGEPPRRYVTVYPFVRTADWYLLPEERRAALLREHGEIGRQFPDVLTNTTSAFGLGDWEWVLAFEADDLSRLVDCIRRLRAAEARRFTKEEVPFLTGIRKDLVEAVQDLA